ncbi:MAG: tetraacyldisaccharide 4'-kinase [Pseudomonadota bacterium]|nr:tetraacyldisaccharide 4'-kinase [Pseudomonadota bacterium]
MNKFFEQIWRSSFNVYSLVLFPFSLIFFIIIKIRRTLYKYGILVKYKSPTPLIIIGNITIGGTGKTPFVIWLANHLANKGLKVGVISSGYKSTSKTPEIVNKNSNANQVGDEAVLIAKHTDSIVVSGGSRVDATKLLTSISINDIILHDDGLQHYKLERDYEIILVNSKNLFGNGLLLPAGPLREPKSRLEDADIVAYTNDNNESTYSIASVSNSVVNSVSKESKNIEDFTSKKIHLVTGIASMEMIIENLISYKIQCIPHKYDDHHIYDGSEVIFDDNHPVFITQKDYVKLSDINNKNIWIIDHKVKPNELLITKLNSDLNHLLNI